MNGYTLAAYIADNALERGSALGGASRSSCLWFSCFRSARSGFEVGFSVVMLWPRLTWVFVLGGVALHAGIFLLQRAPFPQLIALYVVFLVELRRWRPRENARAPVTDPVWSSTSPR
jgi:hypothetical protein